MITEAQYFSRWRYAPDVTAQCVENANNMLKAVNSLMYIAVESGISFPINPATRSQISGAEFGGYRPIACPIGAVNSAHKKGLAVDIYDPTNEIDAWVVRESGKGGLLEICGIYVEHPSKTQQWSHWSTRAPGSGHRVFWP